MSPISLRICKPDQTDTLIKLLTNFISLKVVLAFQTLMLATLGKWATTHDRVVFKTRSPSAMFHIATWVWQYEKAGIHEANDPRNDWPSLAHASSVLCYINHCNSQHLAGYSSWHVPAESGWVSASLLTWVNGLLFISDSASAINVTFTQECRAGHPSTVTGHLWRS